VILSDEPNGSEAGSGKRQTVGRIEIVVGLGFWPAWRKKSWICTCNFSARVERIRIER
jgi:hypothetical protein